MSILPIRFWSTERISKRIDALRAEQAEMTRQLFSRDIDAIGRASIDIRERELISETMQLVSERARRGRRLAEGMGFIKSKEETKS